MKLNIKSKNLTLEERRILKESLYGAIRKINMKRRHDNKPCLQYKFKLK